MADDKLPEVIEGWRGQKIAGARSRGAAVFAAVDWREMVLDSAGDIETKAADVAGRAAAWFAPEAFTLLTSVSGRYSNVQSINSEDTVTWAAFGPRASARAVGAIVDLAFGAQSRPEQWSRLFWERSTHPHTQKTTGGPEPDVTLCAENGWCYVIEAKWAADLDDKQGKDGDMTQLEMRADVARRLATEPSKRGVLVIAPGPERYPAVKRGTFAKYFAVDGNRYVPRDAARALEARVLTWEQIVDVLARTDGPSELIDYLKWRLARLPLTATCDSCASCD